MICKKKNNIYIYIVKYIVRYEGLINLQGPLSNPFLEIMNHRFRIVNTYIRTYNLKKKKKKKEKKKKKLQGPVVSFRGMEERYVYVLL